MNDTIFSTIPIVAVLIFVVAVLVIIFTMVSAFSPKLRGKMLSKQIKAAKYMVEESKDDIEYISNNMADATKGGVETTVRAIKKGIVDDEEEIYCKHCGSRIDKDSKFCKNCGKEQ